MPTISDRIKEPTVVCKLLTIAVLNPRSLNSCTKWLPVNAWGIMEMCPVISLVGRIAIATSQ